MPPGTLRLPMMALRPSRQKTACMEWRCAVGPRPERHTAGLCGSSTPLILMVLPTCAASPKSRHTRRMVSTGTVVMGETYSGLYCFKCSASNEKAGRALTPLTSYSPNRAESAGATSLKGLALPAAVSQIRGLLVSGSRTYSSSGPTRYGPLVLAFMKSAS